MAEFSLEELSVFLPKYLSPEKQQGLFEELKQFPKNVAFYDPSHDLKQSVLQGDGWKGLIAINFETLAKKPVSGVIISNSCDIDVKNDHDHAPNVLFAPIVSLAGFIEILRKAGKTEHELTVKLDVIRRQRISSLFHLPKYNGVIEESIIVLDDIHRHPLNDFIKTDRAKLFTLTQLGFYIFVFKMSIHFHRLNEGLARFVPPK